MIGAKKLSPYGSLLRKKQFKNELLLGSNIFSTKSFHSLYQISFNNVVNSVEQNNETKNVKTSYNTLWRNVTRNFVQNFQRSFSSSNDESSQKDEVKEKEKEKSDENVAVSEDNSNSETPQTEVLEEITDKETSKNVATGEKEKLKKSRKTLTAIEIEIKEKEKEIKEREKELKINEKELRMERAKKEKKLKEREKEKKEKSILEEKKKKEALENKEKEKEKKKMEKKEAKEKSKENSDGTKSVSPSSSFKVNRPTTYFTSKSLKLKREKERTNKLKKKYFDLRYSKKDLSWWTSKENLTEYFLEFQKKFNPLILDYFYLISNMVDSGAPVKSFQDFKSLLDMYVTLDWKFLDVFRDEQKITVMEFIKKIRDLFPLVTSQPKEFVVPSSNFSNLTFTNEQHSSHVLYFPSLRLVVIVGDEVSEKETTLVDRTEKLNVMKVPLNWTGSKMNLYTTLCTMNKEMIEKNKVDLPIEIELSLPARNRSTSTSSSASKSRSRSKSKSRSSRLKSKGKSGEKSSIKSKAKAAAKEKALKEKIAEKEKSKIQLPKMEIDPLEKEKEKERKEKIKSFDFTQYLQHSNVHVPKYIPQDQRLLKLNKLLVLDGANLFRVNQTETKSIINVAKIKNGLQYLEELGHKNVVIICSASYIFEYANSDHSMLPYYTNKDKEYIKGLIVDGTLKLLEKTFYEDKMLLEYASANDGFVISNDKFRQEIQDGVVSEDWVENNIIGTMNWENNFRIHSKIYEKWYEDASNNNNN